MELRESSLILFYFVGDVKFVELNPIPYNVMQSDPTRGKKYET